MTDLDEIQALRAEGVFVADIARMFSVSRACVTDITTGVKWKHLLQPATQAPEVKTS